MNPFAKVLPIRWIVVAWKEKFYVALKGFLVDDGIQIMEKE